MTIIHEKRITIKRLEIIRDLFLFGCYTGLSFSDIKELSDDDIQIGVDKNLWIIKKRRKTGIVSKIPLLDIPAGIINKYKVYPKPRNTTALLPAPSNQKMNSYLKEIADISGIEKTLTTHTARRNLRYHSYASEWREYGGSVKDAGHTSLFMTRKYAKVDEFYIAQETEKVRKIFSKLVE